MRLAIGKINDDFVGTGINLERYASLSSMFLLRECAAECFGNGQLQVGDLGRGEIGAASDFPDKPA